MVLTPEPIASQTVELRSHTCVGRENELREMTTVLDFAIAKKAPQTLTIFGTAGIGKTRIIEEFLKRAHECHPTLRSYRGRTQQGRGPAFLTIQRILQVRFGITESMDVEASRTALRTKVAEVLHDQRVTEFVHFLGAYLDLKFPDSPFIRALEEEPKQFPFLCRTVLRRFFEVDAQETPLLLTFEDLQWAQEDTLALVQYLMRSIQSAPILLIATARSELLASHPDWMDSDSRHHRIDLSTLTFDAASQLVRGMLMDSSSPPRPDIEEVVDAAVETASGSPYLLEQMVRILYDNGTLERKTDGALVVHAEMLEEAELPFTIDDAIQARISALRFPERELLEQASTMGSVFWLGGLIAISRMDKATPDLWCGHESGIAHVTQCIEALAERDYILAIPDSSIAGEQEYAFKHNLERETIHRLATGTRRIKYHRVVAEWLDFRLTERNEEQCELLAHHYELGGATHKAALFYIMAGHRARDRNASVRAASYYVKGLELFGEGDPSDYVNALHHYGDVLQVVGKNHEALEIFKKMLDISFRLDLMAKGGAAHNRIGRVYRTFGQFDEAMRHLGAGLALFERVEDKRGIASSLDDIGKVHWMRGACEAAETFLKRALHLREELNEPRSLALSYNNIGLVYVDSGRLSQAQQAFQSSLEICQQIDDPRGISQSLHKLGRLQHQLGNDAKAMEYFNQSLDIARRIGDRLRQAIVLTSVAASHNQLSEAVHAFRVLKEAEDISHTIGDRVLQGEIQLGLARAHMRVTNISLANDCIQRSVALFEKTRRQPQLGIALRVQGEILGAQHGTEAFQKACECFERAILLFEELGHRIEQARSYSTYAAFLETKGSGDTVLEKASDLRIRAREVQSQLNTSTQTDAMPPVNFDATRPEIDISMIPDM